MHSQPARSSLLAAVARVLSQPARTTTSHSTLPPFPPLLLTGCGHRRRRHRHRLHWHQRAPRRQLGEHPVLVMPLHVAVL